MKNNHSPSTRSQAIYCRVMIEGCAIAQVAQESKVSVDRIKTIVAEVKRWICRSPSVAIHDNHRAAGDALRQLHVARLEHQWEQLMLAWYRSTQAEETEKVVGDEHGKRKAEMTRRTQTGDVKYLQQAREIMAEMRSLSTPDQPHEITNPEDLAHVESLTLAQREAALDCLLETLGRRAREAEAGGVDPRQNAAA